MTSAYPMLKNPDSTIRLLHIHPSNDLWGIEATLESVSFLERPQYRALSYTWGDVTRTMPITVNGKRMDITESLWIALFHIRDKHETQTLWVDAICINQKNNEEKGVQVPLMSFIYARAQEVIVWLGDHHVPRWVAQSSLSRWNGDWAVVKGTEYWPVTKYWLYLLIEEDYWNRCWIVQEIAMGSRIQVHSGRSTLPWADFVKLTKLYKSKTPLETGAIENILRLERLREARYINGSAYSLPHLLEEFSDCFSSTILDKIYSFVGLAGDCLQDCIQVDYTKSPLAVYQDLIWFWNRRVLQCANKATGTVYFAGLVRSILLRTWKVAPKTLNTPRVGESPETFLYAICGDDRADHCSLIPTLGSFLTWVDLMNRLSHRLLSYAVGSKRCTRSLWLPSTLESSSVWAAKTEVESNADSNLIRVSGVVAGVVCELGPTYREFIEQPTVLKRWAIKLNTIWGLACNGTSMKSAKVLNERLVTLLGAAADYRLRNFVSLDTDTPYSFYSSRLFVAFGPRREVVMGLAPWETIPGDILVQFPNSNAALVVRSRGSKPALIVGRAGVVKDGDTMDWDVPDDTAVSPDLSFDLAIPVSMLTRLSLDTICFPGTELPCYREKWETLKDTWTSHDFEMKDIGVFEDKSSYDNLWEINEGAKKEVRGLDNSERDCFSRPCQVYVYEPIEDRFLYGIDTQ